MIWSQGGGIIYRSGKLFQPLLDRFSNLGGRNLVIAGNDGKVFTQMTQLENKTWIATGGIDIAVCNILAQKLNFT